MCRLSAAEPQMVIASFPIQDDFNAIMRQLVLEAYARVGVKVEIRSFPGERAIIMANSGAVDGDLFRIAGVEEQYKNLMMIPEAVHQMHMAAFAKDVRFEVKGWASLAPYRISYEIGTKLAEENIKGMMLEPVVDSMTAFRMLDMGRSDVALESYIGGMSVIRSLKLEDIYVLRPMLETLDMYHYVHKRHRELVPQLTKVIRQMKAENRQTDITRQVMTQVDSGL